MVFPNKLCNHIIYHFLLYSVLRHIIPKHLSHKTFPDENFNTNSKDIEHRCLIVLDLLHLYYFQVLKNLRRKYCYCFFYKKLSCKPYVYRIFWLTDFTVNYLSVVCNHFRRIISHFKIKTFWSDKSKLVLVAVHVIQRASFSKWVERN